LQFSGFLNFLFNFNTVEKMFKTNKNDLKMPNKKLRYSVIPKYGFCYKYWNEFLGGRNYLFNLTLLKKCLKPTKMTLKCPIKSLIILS